MDNTDDYLDFRKRHSWGSDVGLILDAIWHTIQKHLQKKEATIYCELYCTWQKTKKGSFALTSVPPAGLIQYR